MTIAAYDQRLMLRTLSDFIQTRLSPRSLTWIAGVFFLCAVVGVVRTTGSEAAPSNDTAAPTTTAPAVIDVTTTVAPTTTVVDPGSNSAETTVAPEATTTTRPARVPLTGFDTVAMAINSGGGARSYCSLLAQNADQQERGLMNQQNLGGFDAMLFRFAEDTNAQFYMANVVIPLSVAWFDSRGNFVSATDMPICTTQASECPRYDAAGKYRYAVEVPQGQLGELGIGSGSTMSLGLACT